MRLRLVPGALLPQLLERPGFGHDGIDELAIHCFGVMPKGLKGDAVGRLGFFERGHGLRCLPHLAGDFADADSEGLTQGPESAGLWPGDDVGC